MVYEGDTAESLADDFCKKHKLDEVANFRYLGEKGFEPEDFGESLREDRGPDMMGEY